MDHAESQPARNMNPACVTLPPESFLVSFLAVRGTRRRSWARL